MQNAAKITSPECLLRVRQALRLLAGILSIWAMGADIRAYAQNPPSEHQTSTPSTDPRLPIGAPARITVRYPVENSAARQRAIDLVRGLGEQGLDGADPVASLGRIGNSTVSYFYVEDRPGAEIAVRVLGPAWKPVQQRLPTREPFPRPGTLELAVAGP